MVSRAQRGHDRKPGGILVARNPGAPLFEARVRVLPLHAPKRARRRGRLPGGVSHGASPLGRAGHAAAAPLLAHEGVPLDLPVGPQEAPHRGADRGSPDRRSLRPGPSHRQRHGAGPRAGGSGAPARAVSGGADDALPAGDVPGGDRRGDGALPRRAPGPSPSRGDAAPARGETVTCPLSNDVLLDWALLRSEADPAVDDHLRACAPCRERSRAVLEEQALLRGAFAEPSSPSGLTRRVIPARPPQTWSRIGVAALLAVVLGGSLLILLTARYSTRAVARYRHSPLAPIQSDLGVMAQKIAVARGTLPESEDPRTSAAYLALLATEETLYIEGMAHYLSERSPLSDEQELELRRT